MLHELRIENLLLIERAELRLGEGLNAITGETGAGKTVLAHSLDLLMGGKARPQIVRPGAEEAWVEGVFDLPTALLDEPELAELAERAARRRRRGRPRPPGLASGRTSAFVAGAGGVGGRPEAARRAAARLLRPARASQADDLLGPAGDPRRLRRRRAPRAPRARYREAHARVPGGSPPSWPSCASATGSRERDLDLLPLRARGDRGGRRPTPRSRPSWRRSASGCATPRACAAAAGARTPALAGADEDGGGAAAALAEAESLLQARRPASTPALDAIAERVGALAVELGDVGDRAARLRRGDRGRPGRLAAVEERLEALDRLRAQARRQRRVGARARRALPGRDRAARGRRGARRRGSRRRWPRPRRGARSWPSGSAPAAPTAARAAREAGRRRARASWRWPARRSRSCSSRTPTASAPTGRETVELRLAPNPGIEAAPLRDAASGGELSRVMLALSGLGAGAGAATLVFDEIDAGIGGNTARVVGERLRALGDGPPGPLHHPPAPGRLAGRRPTSGSRRTSPASRRSPTVRAARRRGAWSRRSAACSAASAPTRRPPATPASCSRPPDRR